jgi:hypothetical protein
MSAPSYRTLANVTLILFENSVQFFISRSIPSGNIVHLFATDADISQTDTNNAQTWKLSKTYTKATTIPDVIYVRVTCSNGSVPTPPFFTISYTYYVTVIDARISFPTQELVLLTSDYNPGNTRTLEYFYDLPTDFGVVSLAPSTLSDPNPISEFTAEGSTTIVDGYGPPTVEVVPNGASNYRVRVLQSFGDAGLNEIQFTLLFNRYNAYRKYSLKYRVLQVGNVAVGGFAAAPFLIDFMSYDHALDNKIAARYIHNAVAGGEQLVLNSSDKFAAALGDNIAALPPIEWYGKEVEEAVDQAITVTDEFPLVKLKRQNKFVSFELDNRSTVADYKLFLRRRIDFDNGAYIRCDPLITKLLGFTSDESDSTEDPISNFQTIAADQALTCVVPPIISLELEAVVNNHEGVVRQSQSVRLFNFLMLDGDCDYKTFVSTKEFPERQLPLASSRYQVLKFHFLYNRMNEVSNIGPVGIGLPVQFKQPYYVTMRIQTRSRDGRTDESYITLTGTESSPIINLDSPIEGIQCVEMVDARMPKFAEGVALVDQRRAILGYVVDESLPAPVPVPP